MELEVFGDRKIQVPKPGPPKGILAEIAWPDGSATGTRWGYCTRCSGHTKTPIAAVRVRIRSIDVRAGIEKCARLNHVQPSPICDAQDPCKLPAAYHLFQNRTCIEPADCG